MRYCFPLIVAAVCISSSAIADNEVALVDKSIAVQPACDNPDSCPFPKPKPAEQLVPDRHHWALGFGMDLGIPSGATLGFVVHPSVDWVSIEASFAENVLSPGGRLSVKFDPFALLPRLPIALFADVQGGFFGKGNIPGHAADLPSLGYQYANFYVGLRLGRAQDFHWFFEAGPTFLNLSTSNFQSIVPKTNGLTVNDPTARVWATPTFVTGFEVSWGI